MATAILPDSPISTLEGDLLGRRPFAQSLADLIINAPSGSSLKIGVFGGWGQGKTSVLQLVRQILITEGHVCAWLVPWVTENREQVVRQLTQQIAEMLEIDLQSLKLAESVERLAGKARELARGDVKLRVFEALIGPAVQRLTGTFAARQGAALAQAITDALGSRKLIVFVDDLDRVKPELVPGLLLTLREALDRPDFFYIMALDPAVVEAGLKSVHEGWGTHGDFLEKIIEIPRFLPEPTDEAVRTYAERLLSSAGSMDPTPVSDILPLLPRNPRKLKLFVRYIATLAPLLNRFADWEIDWRAFYILQLLQLEFPEPIRLAVKDSDFVKDVQDAFARNLMHSGSADSVKKDRAPSELELKYVGSSSHAERFSELCGALRERPLSAWSYYGLADMLTLSERGPLFTYGECTTIVGGWISSPPEEAQRNVLAEVSVSGNLDSVKCRAFWRLLMEIRDIRMNTIVQEDLQDRITEGLAEVSALTRLASFLAIDNDGFRRGLLSLEEWKALYRVSGKWAYFRMPEFYQKVREEERGLLQEAFGCLSDEERAGLYTTLEGGITEEGVTRAPEFREMLQSLANEAALSAVLVTLRRFSEPDGLQGVWAETMDNAWGKILFRHNSVLYTNSAHRDAFLARAHGAKDDAVSQLNFLVLFRQLAYGATQPSSFPIEECRRILADKDVAMAVWNAAISRPLNPRTTGSLRQHRLKLIRTGLVAEDQMPIPAWWERLEAAGFWKDSELGSDEDP